MDNYILISQCKYITYI